MLVCVWVAAVAVFVASLVVRVPDVLGRAGLLGVPVGGGPPASRPRRELRSARRLEARPGPAGLAAASNRSGCLCDARPGLAAAHGYRSQALSAS